MRKKVLSLFFLVLASALLFGCSMNDNPKDSFNTYISAWKKSNFSGMYKFLSSDSKKNITQDNFTKRYKNIYDGISLSKITVTPQYPGSYKKDSKGLVEVPFTVNMDTVAGQVKFKDTAYFKKETQSGKDAWKLVWSSKMIFPDLKDDNKIRVTVQAGKRGQILDSKGAYLAQNGMIYQVGIVPQKLGSNADDSKNKIAQILGISKDSIDKKLSASYVTPDMFVAVGSISYDDTQKKTALLNISGVKLNDKAARVYPLKEAAAQLVGYVQNVNAEDLQKHKGEGYTDKDVIGKAGLEQIYEKDLRAQDGAEIYIADKDGTKIKTIAKQEEKDGKDIKLTIDSSIQSSMYAGLKSDQGAGVAMDPKTGAVLALVSTPSYNPNDFVLGMSDTEWKSLSSDANKPLSIRFASTFAPGSSFKPVTAAIGLESGKLKVDTAKTISGLKWQKDSSWGNYFVTRVEESSGPESLTDAFVKSDNIYFAQAALDIGSNNFIDGVKKFGLGEKLPFEYGIQTSQLSSDGKIKDDIQLADSGYGQGQVLISPLHLASIYTSFVNDGNMINPYLNAESTNKSKVWKSNAFSKDTASIILNDLTQVVSNPSGTGHAAYIQSIPIAGKTGTAEIKKSQTDTTGTENGWFAAVNTNNPKLLVVEMVENAKDKGGSHYVVPKVKDLFSQFCK